MTEKLREIRLNLIALRGDICEKCHRNKASAMHHVDRNQKNNSFSNLILLCADCHRAIHKELKRPLLKTTGNPFYRRLEA